MCKRKRLGPPRKNVCPGERYEAAEVRGLLPAGCECEQLDRALLAEGEHSLKLLAGYGKREPAEWVERQLVLDFVAQQGAGLASAFGGRNLVAVVPEVERAAQLRVAELVYSTRSG